MDPSDPSSRSDLPAGRSWGLLWWIPVLAWLAPLQVTANAEVAAAETADRAPGAALEFIHVVEPGESLWKISRRYRIPVEELARTNGIDEEALIRPEDELRVRLAPVPDLAAASLGAAGAVEPPREAPADELARPRAPLPPDAETLARRAEAQLRQAYFEEALATADDALERLASRGDRGSHARLAMVAGTAELALGNHEAALERFAEALAADPELRADPREMSPKVLRLLEAARARRAAPREERHRLGPEIGRDVDGALQEPHPHRALRAAPATTD